MQQMRIDINQRLEEAAHTSPSPPNSPMSIDHPHPTSGVRFQPPSPFNPPAESRALSFSHPHFVQGSSRDSRVSPTTTTPGQRHALSNYILQELTGSAIAAHGIGTRINYLERERLEINRLLHEMEEMVLIWIKGAPHGGSSDK